MSMTSFVISASRRLARILDATFLRCGYIPFFLSLFLILLILGDLVIPQSGVFTTFLTHTDDARAPSERWKQYTLKEAAAFVARNGTVIVCTVTQPFLPFLNNWLISVSRQGRAGEVLVVAEDNATLHEVNTRWPGHAVSTTPALLTQSAYTFGSKGFFNLTSHRPRHLLQILELGYNVLYNDVDMVWLADPFPYFEGKHDIYVTDDSPKVRPLNHSHVLRGLGKMETYLCSCMIFLRPTNRTKNVIQTWAEELEAQTWSASSKTNDQPFLNSALKRHADEVDLYLLPQSAFPCGGLYFGNPKWAKETQDRHVIIHNNYIMGYGNKRRRFQQYGLWLADEHFNESPLGRI